jgi:hypothetical protein
MLFVLVTNALQKIAAEQGIELDETPLAALWA